ncbi:HTH-type transcriptional regulator CysL [Pseudomonas sp. MM221]|nr:HTH-type transcriptional regulator CysL [Pseudomonas sp. MM221]
MNLFQLRAFDAVAREGSFTRAAERLFISQPAVTGHVKALEEHYQITLLRRTARRVELTEEGTRLAAITRAMFGLAEEAQAMLEANRQLLTGRLEVAADGPHRVMPMLAQLRERYPGITVNLRLGNAQETLAALLSEHADVAVLTEIEPRKGLHLQNLCESRLCALLPVGHDWARGRVTCRWPHCISRSWCCVNQVRPHGAPSTRRVVKRLCNLGCCWAGQP